MGWKFSKRKKILPGVTLNFGKRGIGIRVGTRNAGISVGPSGTRASASIPGTGVSVSQQIKGSSNRQGNAPRRGIVGSLIGSMTRIVMLAGLAFVCLFVIAAITFLNSMPRIAKPPKIVARSTAVNQPAPVKTAEPPATPEVKAESEPAPAPPATPDPIVATVVTHEFRSWESSNGKFKTEARFVSIEDDGKVSLEKRDGKVVQVDPSKLCDADREYISETRLQSQPTSTNVKE